MTNNNLNMLEAPGLMLLADIAGTKSPINHINRDGKRQRVHVDCSSTTLELDKCPACDIASEYDDDHRTAIGNYHLGCIRWVTSEERWQMLQHFAELARCTCCERHQTKRPESLEGGWIESPKGNQSPRECECSCRNDMRRMCRLVQGGTRFPENCAGFI